MNSVFDQLDKVRCVVELLVNLGAYFDHVLGYCFLNCLFFFQSSLSCFQFQLFFNQSFLFGIKLVKKILFVLVLSFSLLINLAQSVEFGG